MLKSLLVLVLLFAVFSSTSADGCEDVHCPPGTHCFAKCGWSGFCSGECMQDTLIVDEPAAQMTQQQTKLSELRFNRLVNKKNV
ncbi:unnamed protein product, partial [Mesorhabditis belari]|uniref:Uncharacterized protein n=1 Tax=Mesorhabditis belari TaxID=2138241 RepID=A0AAF3J5L7_9BILA